MTKLCFQYPAIFWYYFLDVSFPDRKPDEYKFGFGNPYFDYFIGHDRLEDFHDIAVELKDSKSRKIRRN